MSDKIKHPSHYAEGRKYEPKDVIRDWGLNFNLGSAVKYISRAGRKDDIVQDLKKAQQFIQFEIDAIEAERGNTPKAGEKVERIPLDDVISIRDILNMGVTEFLKMLRGRVPHSIVVAGKVFRLTEINLDERIYKASPTITLYCENDDFELRLRSKR
jgi:hypothetical protein